MEKGVHSGHRDRMRERFLKSGLNGFAPHEALELLLFYSIPQKDINPLAHALIERYGSLAAVFDAPVDDLITVKGVKMKTAVLLNLVPKICDMARVQESKRNDQVLGSADAAGRYLLKYLRGETNEVVYMVSMNADGMVLTCEKLEEGSVSRARLSTRKVVERALVHSASRVILGHNHPGGSPAPSAEDIASTARIKEALYAIDVRLDDHIIVAGDRYASMSNLALL